MENSPEVLNIKSEQAEERISEPEYMSIKIMQSQEQKKNEEKLTEPQRPIGQQTLYRYMHIGSPRRKEKGQKE